VKKRPGVRGRVGGMEMVGGMAEIQKLMFAIKPDPTTGI